jgi:hypothetical protein
MAGNGVVSREEMLLQLRRSAGGMNSPSSKNMRKGGKGEGESKWGESKSSGSATGIISEGRIKELDWNSDNRITFKEFLFAYEGWTGLTADDEE